MTVVDTIAPLLGDARLAIAKREPAGALAPLLRAWAIVRAPELAELIERLSDSLRRTRPPIGGATQAEVEEAWRDRAKQADAIDLAVLLACLADTDSYKACKRLRLLNPHAPDPRVASTLVGLILAPPFNTSKFWQYAHELLLACADPRALARLEQVPANQDRLDAARRRSVENLRTKLAELTIELAPEQLAELQAITAALDQLDANHRDPGPELLAAIVEHPDELERRQVYADYLLEIGDPRGEFIALQLAERRGTLDRRLGRARVTALLREHANAWLGPVGRILVRSATRFEAGFLSVARIKQSPRGLAALLDDPIWATVERLELPPIELAKAPMLRSLRSVSWTAFDLGRFASSAENLGSVTELHIELPSQQRYDRHWAERLDDARRALERESLVPTLTRVRLDVDSRAGLDEVAWLWTGPLGQRLERIELRIAADSLGLASYVRSVRAVESATLREIEIHHGTIVGRLVRTDAGSVRVELRPGSVPNPSTTAAELASLESIAGLELVHG